MPSVDPPNVRVVHIWPQGPVHTPAGRLTNTLQPPERIVTRVSLVVPTGPHAVMVPAGS